jgi:hypothetical protein
MRETLLGRLIPYAAILSYVGLLPLNYYLVSFMLAPLGFIFMLCPGFFSSVFGRELCLGATRCEIAVDSVPDGNEATIKTLEPPYLPQKKTLLDRIFTDEDRKLLVLDSVQLRHSIYNNPECAPAIVEWLETENLVPIEEASEKIQRKILREQERDVTKLRWGAITTSEASPQTDESCIVSLT